MRFPVREMVVLPIAVAVYALVLHWVYADLVTDLFSYLGYRYTSPSPQIVALNWFFALGVALVLPRHLGKPSAVVLWILYVITVAPAILMAPYTSYLDDGEALLLGLVLATVYGSVAIGTRGTPRPIPVNLSPTSFWIILAVFSALTYGLLMFTQGLSLQFVNLLDVYSLRAEYSDAQDGVGLLSYLVFTQANVVNPMIIARGLYTRRLLPVLVGVLGQLVLFSGTGFKTFLFAIPAWFIVAWLFRRRQERVGGIVFVWGAVGLMAVSAVVDVVLQNHSLWTSLLSRRFILTPGTFTSVYVQFFSENPQVHLGHSVLRYWVDYPYEMTPPHVIGEWMAGLPQMAANANLFADGFANFGWAGLVGAAVVLLVYLRIADRAAVGLPIAVSAIVMTMPAVALSNTSVLTAMLSHGLVVGVLLLAFAPRTGWVRRETSKAPIPSLTAA